MYNETTYNETPEFDLMPHVSSEQKQILEMKENFRTAVLLCGTWSLLLTCLMWDWDTDK